MTMTRRHAFTLVEILIVVVILGILATIVIPLFMGATDEARQNVTFSELQKIRRYVGLYQARNSSSLPDVTEGDGTWGEVVGPDYLLSAPTNAWVGGDSGKLIKFGNGPDTAYQTNYAWIYNTATGEVWAGSFDSFDRPLPRN